MLSFCRLGMAKNSGSNSRKRKAGNEARVIPILVKGVDNRSELRKKHKANVDHRQLHTYIHIHTYITLF